MASHQSDGTHGSLTALRSCVLIHTMNSRDLIVALKADGWFQVRQSGSHVQFKHPTKKGLVTVPHPSRDIARGTLRNIEKQSGLRLR